MKTTFLVLWFCAFYLILVPSAWAYDSEWPPVADPPFGPSNTSLQTNELSAEITNSEIEAWMEHRHTSPGWGWPGDISIGDVDDDGIDDLVLYISNEMVAAFNMDIDWTASPDPSFSLSPIWAMLLPYAERSSNGLNGVAPTSDHAGQVAAPVIIWDLDGDGKNEVAFVYNDNPSVVDHDAYNQFPTNYVYVVQTDPNASNSQPFNLPKPKLLAAPLGSSGQAQIPDRLGVCKVRKDGHDLVAHGHLGICATVVQLTDTSSGGYDYTLEAVYGNRQCCEKITHEFNYTDVDGDGFDEFMRGGVLDYVDADANGDPTPTNTSDPTKGIQRWYAMRQGENAHMDILIAGDFDPDHTGIEILGAPQSDASSNLWYAPDDEEYGEYPILYDKDGEVLGYYDPENYDIPAGHDQAMVAGNWTSTEDGLETIFWPKGGSPIAPPNDGGGGNFAMAADGTPLVVDGKIANIPSSSLKKLRWAGPGKVKQFDWDGTRTTDEMLASSDYSMYVWRLGEKGDWGSTAPDFVPTPTEAQSGWTETWNSTTYNIDGWFFYKDIDVTGHSTPWNENGWPGLYTHYYEKLVEHLVVMHEHYDWEGYDLGKDYREEFVVAGCKYWNNTAFVKIYYNDDTLSTPNLYLSPTVSDDYRRQHQDYITCRTPLQYAELAKLERLEIRSDDDDDPSYVVGMTAGQSAKAVKAIGHYTGGYTKDLTELVDFSTDMPGYIDVYDGATYGGWVSPQVASVSARITATFSEGGTTFTSNAIYISSHSSSDDKPVILMAGYKDSYIKESTPWDTLVIEAYIAQRTNEPMFAVMLNSDSATDFWLPWSEGIILSDDGEGEDEVENDGIYTGTVFAPEYFWNDGNYLKYMLAAVSSDPTNSAKQSDCWPLYKVNGGGGTLVEPSVYSSVNDPGKMAHVRVAGFRGIQNSGLLFLEAEVIPPTTANYICSGLFAHVNTGSGTQYAELDYVGQFDGRHIFEVWIDLTESPFSTFPTGEYIIGVQAWSYDTVSQNFYAGDPWPYIVVHP